MSLSGAIGFLPRAIEGRRLDVLLDAIAREPVSDDILTLAAGLQDAAHAVREAGLGQSHRGQGNLLSRRATGSMARSRPRSPRAARGHG